MCDCVLVRCYADQTCHSHTGVCGYLVGTRVLRLQPPPVPADTLTHDPLRVTKPLSNTSHVLQVEVSCVIVVDIGGGGHVLQVATAIINAGGGGQHWW